MKLIALLLLIVGSVLVLVGLNLVTLNVTDGWPSGEPDLLQVIVGGVCLVMGTLLRRR